MNINIWKNRTTKFAAGIAAVAIMAVAPPVHAVDMELPTAAEVEYFSPEAQQFYAAGAAALDNVDYVNAYSLLSKAAALQPAAVRLNHIVAVVAVYRGRHSPADKAQDFYETAVNSFDNILRVSTITADLRRQVTNEMKSARQEQDNLSQRDVLREAAGTSFIIKYNHEYAKAPNRTAGAKAEASPATTMTQDLINPLTMIMQAQGAQGGQAGFPGAGAPGVNGLPGQGGITGKPGFPGAMPGQPGNFGPGGGGF